MKSKLLCTILMVVLPIAGITTAQESAEVDQDADPRSETSPASSQATPNDSPTVHTSKSGVVTQIAVVNPTDIDLFSGSKKLSEWFDQLCTAASVRSGSDMIRANALMAQAREAILEVGADAVPYLLSQLRIDPTGQVERQLLQMRNSGQRNTVTLDYVDSIILPSTRRIRAARLLGDIGAPAEEALPLLIELWSQDSSLNRTHYSYGVQKILYELNPRPELIQKNFGHWQERLAFETNIIAAAVEYCRELPDDLKSRFDPLPEATDQAESLNLDSTDAPSK